MADVIIQQQPDYEVTIVENSIIVTFSNIGVQGVQGEGVPAGGLAGQKLAKIDGEDFNTEWVDDPDYTGIYEPANPNIQSHISDTDNPHNVTKTQVGLGNVDNTNDLNKPISNATQTALNGKVDENAPITGATKTKITYDAKGLVTGGDDATTADISDTLNKRYVTDADLTKLSNTSGTNTGDETGLSIVDKLGFTPENEAYKVDVLGTPNSTNYPSTALLNDAINLSIAMAVAL